MRTPSKKYLFFLCCVLTFFSLLLAFRLHLFSPTQALQDFDAYMHLISAARSGIDPYTVSTMQTLGPPLVLLPYIPFSFLPHAISSYAWIITSLVLFIVAILYLYRKIGGSVLLFSVVGILGLLAFPVRFTLQMGQGGMITLFLTTYMLFSSRAMLGAFSSVLIIIKTIFLFPLLLLLHQRKEIAICIAVLMLSIFITLIVFPKTTWNTYIQKVVQISTSKSSPVGTDYYNQSLYSTMHRIGMDTLYPVALLFFVLLAYETTRRTQDIRVALIWSLLLSPVSWQHYYTILFPISLTLLFPIKTKNALRWGFWYVLWATQYPFLHISTQSFSPRIGIHASHFFLSGVFLLTWILKEKHNKTR